MKIVIYVFITFSLNGNQDGSFSLEIVNKEELDWNTMTMKNHGNKRKENVSFH